MRWVGVGPSSHSLSSIGTHHHHPTKHRLTSTDSEYAATIAVGLSKLLGDIMAAILLDHWGRRPIMLTSSAGVAVAILILGLALVLGANWVVVLFALCLFMALFSFGLGAVTFLICNEVGR